MRKKLLALLMCATMVLGSSVVASADITSDNYSDAETVFDRGEKISKELDGQSTLTVSKYVDGEGSVLYGFYKNSTIPVRLDSTGKLALDTVDVTVDKTGKGNLSIQADKVYEFVTAYLHDNDKTRTSYDGQSVAFVAKNGLLGTSSASSTLTGEYHVYLATVNANSGYTFSSTALSASEVTIKEYPVKTGTTIDVTGGIITSDVQWKTKDGYCYNTNDKSLQKAFTSATSADDTTKYAYNLIWDSSNKGATLTSNTATTYLVKAVAKAINLGTFDKTAAAVQLQLIQYGVANNTPYIIQNVTTPSAAVTLKIQNDFLSRLKLNGFTSVYYISDSNATDTEAGSYKVVAPLASDIDYSAAYGTFTLPVNFISGNGYLIFAQGNDASQNDGVSTDNTTAAPAADKTTSYTTGDVAPIAALAIVMMGAFGAMVVASKKRV